jgi:hypothetical protein
MRRPAHGGTSRPGPARPGSGYGGPVRSRPVTIGSDERRTDLAWWFERELELVLGIETVENLETVETGRPTEPA